MIYLYYLAHFLTRALPMPVAYAIAVFIADCHYLFSRTDRLRVAENLKVILKVDHVSSREVRGVFHNFGKYLVEFITMTKRLDDAFIKNHIRVENIDFLSEALKQGKGCILISAHSGNWEMASAVLSSLGYSLSVVALPHRDPRVNKFFNDQREFFGTKVIPTSTAIRRCLENLQANQVVALLADRDFGQHGIIMDFLGRPTMVPKGTALFSLKTGAPIIPCFFMRQDNNDFTVTFGSAVNPSAVTNVKASEDEIVGLIKKYLPVIEEQIRQRPTQWLMFREFWVTS